MKLRKHLTACFLLWQVASPMAAWCEPAAAESNQPATAQGQEASEAKPEAAPLEVEKVAQTTPAASPSPAPQAAPADAKKQAQDALLEGRELNRKGFTESAIVQYRKAIELDPELAQAYIELGKILMDTKNQAFAITIYTKLSELQPQDLRWKEILFDLHTAYEMPREAALDGEEILKAKPDDVVLMKRLAEVYKGYGLSGKYAETLERAAAITKEAKLYFDAGEAYLAADMKPEAVAAYQRAVAIAPDNLEYQGALGKGLNAAGRSYEARELYATLLKQHPEATGLKDRQIETEISIGDRLLEKRRYVAARKAYENAQVLLGGPSTQGLGPSLTERIAKAERLNHVYLDNWVEGGQQGGNDFLWINSMVGVPLQSSDVTFQLMNDNRSASAPGLATQSINSILAGVDYKMDENTQLFAMGGSNGIWRLGANYQDDRVTAGIRGRSDIVSYTPGGIASKLHWTGVDGRLSYQINDWLGVGGDFGFNHYDDGINETLYNLGPFVTPINKPNNLVWGIGYNHGGVFNDRDANPLLRFGPTNFQVDSFGTNLEHWLTKDFRYHLGYYYSITNIGVNGNTYVAGFDYQLGERAYAWFNFEYGNFLQGRVAPGLFQTTDNNYFLQGGLRFTF